jgi:hypothetical protein
MRIGFSFFNPSRRFSGIYTYIQLLLPDHLIFEKALFNAVEITPDIP